jgi:hypothetical protein
VREHLRACTACRAAMRAYRATPAAVAALAPVLPVSRSLLERVQDFLLSLHSRLPGAGGASDGSLAQLATAGGSRGAGMAALAKALAICAGTVGGAAACVLTGVAPEPLGIGAPDDAGAKIERVSQRALEGTALSAPEYEPDSEPAEADAQPASSAKPEPEPEPEPVAAETVEAGAVEYSPPPPEPAASPAPAESSGASSGSPAGEFGP